MYVLMKVPFWREAKPTGIKRRRCFEVLYCTMLSSLDPIYTSSIGTPTDMSASPVYSNLNSSSEEAVQNTSNAAAIFGGVGGIAVIIIAALIVAVVLLVRKKQHLEAGLHHLHYIFDNFFLSSELVG